MFRRLNARVLVLCLALVIFLGLGIACGRLLSESGPTAADGLASSGAASSVHTDWSQTDTGGQSPLLPSIADVVAAVKPSVVTIDTRTTYQLFFRSFTQEGSGSGWIIDQNGTIVTNSHVVEGAGSITVTLNDGRAFTVDPNTVTNDPQSDLAILRINATNLPAARIGDSAALRVGDWVVALGNPLGLGVSAKEGIVSRLGVSLTVESQALNDLIETSAAINPGNSGGPLVNMRGEVIGITSAKISSVGVEGLGYAIGINKAMPILEEFMAQA